MKKLFKLFKKRRIPCTAYFRHYEEGIWKANIIRYEKAFGHKVIDWGFDEELGMYYIKYYIK